MRGMTGVIAFSVLMLLFVIGGMLLVHQAPRIATGLDSTPGTTWHLYPATAPFPTSAPTSRPATPVAAVPTSQNSLSSDRAGSHR